MRVTIIPEDKFIRKDDNFINLPEWNFNDPDIHAIQWYEDHGEIEWKNPQRNEPITDDSILQPYLNALEEYLNFLNTQKITPGPSQDSYPYPNSVTNDNQTLSDVLNS